jgi:UDP-N-acetylmuramyl pentapeptide synthase
MIKRLLEKLLRARAVAWHRKVQPITIAVTGSYGKTSTVQAAAETFRGLYGKHAVRAPEKSFNNEIGIPLSILGEHSPGRSVFGWIGLIARSYRIDAKNAPRFLFLELGADKPGDIELWSQLLFPDYAIITGVSPVHAEFYPSVDAIRAEKQKLAQAAVQGIVWNADDAQVARMEFPNEVTKLSYGVRGDIAAEDIRILPSQEESFESGEVFAETVFDLADRGKAEGTYALKNHLGYAPVMTALASIALVRLIDETKVHAAAEYITKSLKHVPGRLRPLAGIKGSLIIDDSYNAAPAALMNGLNLLSILEPGEEWDRRIAALGSMAELGDHHEEAHFTAGKKVAEVADVFIAVGEGMKIATGAAKQYGMHADQIHHFNDSVEAGRFLDRLLQQGDVVYVKGSQSARMEKLVKDVMANPLQAKHLLVRQEEKWLKS